MFTNEIAIALGIASCFEMDLADHVGAREDFGRLILRIAISDLQAASGLGATILHDVMFYRCADIYI